MPKFCNAAHQVSWFGTQHLSSTLKEFLLFDCEIPQPASSARMQQRFAKNFAIRRVYQGMGSQNPLQRRKRSARSKQQAASREVHSLFLRSRFKLPNGAASSTPRLHLHSRHKLARL